MGFENPATAGGCATLAHRIVRGAKEGLTVGNGLTAQASSTSLGTVSDARKGDRLSEIKRSHVEATACALARTTVLPFPASDGSGGGVTLTVIEDLPASSESSFALGSNVLAMHLGRPARIRQRRGDVSHAWTLTRGDLNLIPAGWRTTSWTEDPIDFLQIELPPELVRRAAGESDGDVDLPCLFSFDDPLCRELSLSMVAEAKAEGAAARMYVEAGAVVLSRRLLALKGRAMSPAPRAGLPPAVLRRAKEFLQAELTRNPGLTELAAAVGMNVHHFSRLFKRSTGLAPHQYLGNIRLERAKRLLAEGRAQIIEIAYELGYANPSHFSAFFRKRTGHSPTEFRLTTQSVRLRAR
jgi:AraC family transcriptional regulator